MKIIHDYSLLFICVLIHLSGPLRRVLLRLRQVPVDFVHGILHLLLQPRAHRGLLLVALLRELSQVLLLPGVEESRALPERVDLPGDLLGHLVKGVRCGLPTQLDFSSHIRVARVDKLLGRVPFLEDPLLDLVETTAR